MRSAGGKTMTDYIRRAWYLTGAAMLLAFPVQAGSLSYSGYTETNQYSPGNLNFNAELDPAQSSDTLGITKMVFAPDALHIAFVDGQAQFGRVASTASVGAQPVQNNALPFASS